MQKRNILVQLFSMNMFIVRTQYVIDETINILMHLYLVSVGFVLRDLCNVKYAEVSGYLNNAIYNNEIEMIKFNVSTNRHRYSKIC